MTEEELGNLLGMVMFNHWEYVLGILGTFIAACGILSWKISKSFHQKECDILRTEISHQKDRFHQYEAVVEQRINLLQSQAELLTEKLSPKPQIFYQDSVLHDEQTTCDPDEAIRFSIAPKPDQSSGSRLQVFLEKTDLINRAIKLATGVI